MGIALNGHTLTLGDGTDPAGLILNGGASITAARWPSAAARA